jgi:hypothetical protein
MVMTAREVLCSHSLGARSAYAGQVQRLCSVICVVGHTERAALATVVLTDVRLWIYSPRRMRDCVL